MATLSSIPADVLGLVFEQCHDFADVGSLMLTCKASYAVWKCCSTSIIWPVALRTIQAAEECLMAVRATHIASQALLAGKLPPKPFPIRELSHRHRKPDATEIKGLLDFSHLARCVEFMHLHSGDSNSPGLGLYPRVQALWLSGPFTASEKLHRALYRSLLLGAVLAGPYHQPLMMAHPDRPKDLLGKWPERIRLLRLPEDEYYWPEEGVWIDTLSAEEQMFLQKHSVVWNHLAGDDAWREEFADISDFLMDEFSRTKTAISAAASAYSSAGWWARLGDARCAILLEVILMMVVSEQFFLRTFYPEWPVRYDGFDSIRHHEDLVMPEPVRTMRIIRATTFSVEELTMPADVNACTECYFKGHLVAYPGGPPTGAPITEIIQEARQVSGYCAYNINGRQITETDELPYPHLLFFQYILRQEFGLEFCDRFFCRTSAQPWSETFQHLVSDHHLFEPPSHYHGHILDMGLLADAKGSWSWFTR